MILPLGNGFHVQVQRGVLHEQNACPPLGRIANWSRVLIAGSASAADLPTKKGPTPAPVIVPPLTWTGFYASLNGTYLGTAQSSILVRGTRGSATPVFLAARTSATTTKFNRSFLARR